MVRFAPLLLVLLASSPTGSESKAPKHDRRVEMSAKGGLKVDLKRRIGVAHTDVVIRRDDVIVCCDRAEAHYSKSQIETVECRGRVVIVRPDGTRARADVAFFEAKKDLLTLSGKARVKSKSTDLLGDKIIYDIAADQLDVRGAGSQFRFDPDPQKPMSMERACPPK